MLNTFKVERCSRIGQLVVEKGWVNEVQLAKALAHQIENQCKLGESLVQLALLTPRQLEKALCKQRWVRSFVAGMVMVSSPICPVLASEANDTLKFVAQADASWLAQDQLTQPLNQDKTNINYSGKRNFQLGISHQFSSRSGIAVGVASPKVPRFADSGYANVEQAIVPQITFFTSPERSKRTNRQGNFQDPERSDRYKNTIPAIYRLTLKGYSIYEVTDGAYDESKFWEFDKVADSPYKSYEVMFSFTKQF